MAEPRPSAVSRRRQRRPVSPAQQDLLQKLGPTTDACSVCLVSVDRTKNRNRLYRLTWQQTLWGQGVLVRWWGRRGSDGQTQTSFYPDVAAAITEFRRAEPAPPSAASRIVLDWRVDSHRTSYAGAVNGLCRK